MSRNLLTARLKKLVARGVLERKRILDQARRHEYVLTEMGEDLLTTIIALRQWGDRWLFRPAPPPILMVDAAGGGELEKLEVRAPGGRVLGRADIRLRRRGRDKPADR
jgi:DNA-binding MarR family transcriptional regulator